MVSKLQVNWNHRAQPHADQMMSLAGAYLRCAQHVVQIPPTVVLKIKLKQNWNEIDTDAAAAGAAAASAAASCETTVKTGVKPGAAAEAAAPAAAASVSISF